MPRPTPVTTFPHPWARSLAHEAVQKFPYGDQPQDSLDGMVPMYSLMNTSRARMDWGHGVTHLRKVPCLHPAAILHLG
jgi:hypothetical protein